MFLRAARTPLRTLRPVARSTPLRNFSLSAVRAGPIDVAGKTAIITGGSSGIGLSLAKLLRSKNCNVVIADVYLSSDVEALVDTNAETGPRVLYKPTDVTSFPQLAALFPFCAERGISAPDIVVPNAGVYEPPWSGFFVGDPVGEPDSRYRQADINFMHPIYLTRLALSSFLKSGKKEAAVIHTSSVAAQAGRFGTPLYNACKAGISMFVRSLAPLEEELGIRVSAVAPGVIKTPLWTDNPEKLRLVDAGEGGRDQWATPEEVADAMLMLIECSDLPGGTILEVGKGNKRIVGQFNDPGPRGEGHSASNRMLEEETIQNLKKERSA